MDNELKKNMKDLLTKFMRIRNQGLVKSLRDGYSGIGYTFETLIGKKEDDSFLPDYKGIEIKTKLGYSKTPITLFTLIAEKNGASATEYLLNTFGYPNSKDRNLKSFAANVWRNREDLACGRYYFNLKVIEDLNKIVLFAYNTDYDLVDSCVYWNLDEIRNRLVTKLNCMAYIKGYPYTVNGEKYYKYISLNFYKLRSFEKFIELINDNKIHITINITTYTDEERYGQIHDCGCAFKIDLNYIDELFEMVKL